MANKFSKTNREMLNAIVDGTILEISDCQAWALHQISLLDKKNAKASTERENLKIENAKTGEQMLAWVKEKNKALSCKQIADHFGLSTQKTTPILKKLVDENKLHITVEKRTNYYSA